MGITIAEASILEDNFMTFTPYESLTRLESYAIE